MSAITKIIRISNSQAVQIPAQLAFNGTDEVEIERVGEELHIRPVRRSLAGAAALFAAFPPDFMSVVERDHDQAQRDSLYRPPASQNDVLPRDSCRAFGVPKSSGARILCGQAHRVRGGVNENI